MKKRVEKVERIFLLLLCIGIGFACTSCRKAEDISKDEEMTLTISSEKEISLPQSDGQSVTEDDSAEEQCRENEEKFYAEAEAQGIDRQTAEAYLQILLDDNLFKDGELTLTGLRIGDIDGNGQIDMLVRVVDVIDAQENLFYGSGGLWFYMNEDEPYGFCEEECPYYGDFDLFWEDIDNDENVEIVFWSQGTGVGATGDFYKAVFKYKNHAIEQMQLPSDLEEYSGEYGLYVEVIQETEENRYTAYCPYFDEQISFRAENIEGRELPATAQSVGENVRGFCDLRVAEYQGKKALQVSEYLKGEGGVVHNVAMAQFLIIWGADGTPKVVEWWIEADENTWANVHESRICYMDGYYYYASQSDHYFLYRVKEDGTSPQCLVKAHVSDICAQDGEVYFVNQSDKYGIYRMNADGTEMKKLCDLGYGLQISAEYVYFYSTDEEKNELFSAFERSLYCIYHNLGGSLYRMKKDGSERRLIVKNVRQYVLSDGNYQGMRYIGSIYCSQSTGEGMAVYQMDLNGQNTKEVCYFEDCGEIVVYGGKIYCDFYGETGKITWYCPENGKMRSLAVSEYTDCCFYKGYFYGIREWVEEEQRKISIYRVDLRNEKKEIVYEGFVSCENATHNKTLDFYATQQGVFFRCYISKQEGCLWFGLTEDGKAWRLEDKEAIPVMLSAEYVEYDYIYFYVLYALDNLESTQGYEAYLAEDLEYEEYYTVGEDGEGRNPYQIRLPQFNEKIAGYKTINRYLQNAYQEALAEKEEFFQMLAEEEKNYGEVPSAWYRYTKYAYVYIGEKYVTVGRYAGGNSGGIRSWVSPSPITFDRTSGEVVSLEDVLGMTTQEAVARLTGSVYKYMEGIGRERFFLENYDELTAKYDPQNFFLFSDGIGIYYEIYDIGCGAEGDYLFIVPWEDFLVFSS
ncbi:MAG: DUF5050 domain-containing protein [Lachnospiraceae bacterium]|nr:DUF5050 domain-containing protein [Lachnospiraceae bacterium]